MPDDPGTGEKVNRFLRLVAANDEGGFEFLKLWHEYCHLVDDIIDDGLWDAETLLRCLMLGCTVYSHPFYQRNRSSLQMPALVATSIYGDSVAWEKDPALWKRQWCEVLRHAGNDVFFAVAMVCGGWEHLRKISKPLFASCYVYHADRYGVPT